MSISSEEQVELDVRSLTDPIFNKLSFEETNNISDTKQDRTTQNIWPIVDLSKLDPNLIDNRRKDELFFRPAENKRGKDRKQIENNNVIFLDNLENKVD